MADVAKLEEKIKRVKKTLSEKRKKESESEARPLELRPVRKRLKRLQRRRRVLAAFLQRGIKGKGETSEKGKTPAAEKPAAEKEVKAG